MTIQEFFFELIRVAIGSQDTLSRPPSKVEWAELYAMSKKQSLVGICFSAVQKLTQNQEPNSGYGLSVMDSGLKKSNQEPITPNQEPEITQNQEPITHNLDEVQYLTWMGMAAKIQQRNEVVNAQCVELQERLSKEGFKSCILKGQGIALLYPENLIGLRQSGDIDVLIDAPMADIVRYARAINPKAHFDYLHVDFDVFDATEVEAHYRPGCMYNLKKNRKLQEWFKENVQTRTLSLTDGEIIVPSVEFNLFYILHHAYRHLINGGIGLRQVMDWYFVLKSRNNANDDDNDNFLSLLKQFGMMRFAKAVSWIILNVFEGVNSINHKPLSINLPIEPDETEGRFLLNEIMMGGNFGHHDSRKEKHKANESKWGILVRKIKTNSHLLAHCPSEVLSAPIYFVWHYYWKKKQINSLQ